MKLFQTVQKNLSTLGISTVQSIEQRPFETRKLIVYLNFAATLIFYLGFLNGEHSFEEYIEDAYRISVAVVLTIHLAIVVLKIKTMLKLLTNCQEALEQSESIK